MAYSLAISRNGSVGVKHKNTKTPGFVLLGLGQVSKLWFSFPLFFEIFRIFSEIFQYGQPYR